jgi:hypothetical protein
MDYRRWAAALAVASLVSGCATGSGRSPHPTQVTEGVSSSTVVTAEELARFGRQGSLMDALQRLRPSMLVSRGGTPLVSLDGSPPTAVSILRTIPASTVREVRLHRPSSSLGQSMVLPNGDVVVGDVIAVTTFSGNRRQPLW